MPIRRKAVPSQAAFSSCRAGSNRRTASCVGGKARAGAGQEPELRILQLQRDAPAREVRRLEPARDLLGRAATGSARDRRRRAGRVSKVVSAETLFVSRSGVDPAVVLAPGEPRPGAAASRPSASKRVLQRHLAQMADPGHADLREPRLRGGADARDHRRPACRPGSPRPPRGR